MAPFCLDETGVSPCPLGGLVSVIDQATLSGIWWVHKLMFVTGLFPPSSERNLIPTGVKTGSNSGQ